MYYEFIGNKHKSNKITSYFIKDIHGVVEEFSRDKVKSLLNSGTVINGLYLDKAGRIRRKTHSNNTYTNVEILTGNDLITRCKQDVCKYTQRDYVKSIVNFCLNDVYDRVYIVYGLRRTGKTVSIKHSILNINDLNNTLSMYLITINSNINANELLAILRNITDAIVFIDEITRVNDIINYIHILSDTLSSSNRIKIVLTGTDSYVFSLANQTNLFGRAFYYHSTIIDYSEYRKLTNRGIQEYMVDGTLFGSLYSDDNILNTINGMVIGNIINTLNRNKSYLSNNGIYSNICNLNIGTLGALVYYILISACDSKVKRDITSIASKPLGNSKIRFLSNALNIEKQSIPKIIQGIANNDFFTVMAILNQLDLIRQVNNLTHDMIVNTNDADNIKAITDLEVCVTQPGLLWSLLTLFNTDKSIKIGKVTENLVFISLYSNRKNAKYNIIDIGYIRYDYMNTQREVDVVLRINNNIKLEDYNVYIEVKSGNTQKWEYGKNLRDESFKLFKDGIKIIVYNGKTDDSADTSTGIRYVNLVDFLIDPWKYIIE